MGISTNNGDFHKSRAVMESLFHYRQDYFATVDVSLDSFVNKIPTSYFKELDKLSYNFICNGGRDTVQRTF